MDARAARRLLQALIVKTDDALSVRWLGHQIWQYPMDAWLIQEAISELRPGLVVETGTYRGGSAFFYATIFDLLGMEGAVVTIDVEALETIEHPRITYLTGSSVDPEIVSEVERRVEHAGGGVLFVLDSDHRAPHVRAELKAYAPLVPVGSYFHVQDGIIDELPIYAGENGGPKLAAVEFLAAHPEFERDVERERRYLMTGHPCGWLRRREG